MAENKEEILIEIVVSNDAATKAIFESQQSIERLKNSQKDLNKSYTDGNITAEEYSKKTTALKVAIDQQKESIRQNEKELKNNIKSQKENNDSLSAMRAQLSNNVKEFDNLSKAERESAKGQELQKSISELTGNLKEAEEATGRFQRSVGNYPQAMNPANQSLNMVSGFLGKLGDQLGGLGSQSSKIGNVFSSMSQRIGGFAEKASEAQTGLGDLNNVIGETGEAGNVIEGFSGKATGGLNNLASTSQSAAGSVGSSFSSIGASARSMGMVFLTPPVIVITAIILAIIAVIKLLQHGFKLNGEASDKMTESFAVLEPILDAVGQLAAYLAGIIADLVHFLAEGVAGIIDFTTSLFGMQSVLKSTAKESMALVKAQNELEDAEREFGINTAERALKRAKIMAEVADKEKNNAQQRVALLKDALDIDKQNLEEEKRIANESLRIIEARAKKESDTSDETADKIAEARIKALNAETSYFEGVKEINKKLSAAEAEIEEERKANFEKWKERHDEMINKQRQLLQQLEDLTIQQIKDELDRQIIAETTKTDRANEELKRRLETEKNLTKTSKEAINQIIVENEKILNAKIDELKTKANEANIKKEIEAKQRIIEAEIQLAENQSRQELDLQIARLELKKQTELNNINLTNVERLAILDRYQQQELDLSNKFLIEKQNKIKKSLDEQYELVALNIKNTLDAEEQRLNLEVEIAQRERDALLNIDSETKNAMFENQIQYEIAVKKSQNRLIDANQAVLNQQIAGVQSFASSMKSITASVSQLISTLSNDSYEAAQFAKGLAVVNIGIALAEGIAGVVKASSKTSTWVEMLAAIASGTAAVVSTIAAAKNAFEATPEPKKPSFATGGLITGTGTGTSDSISAMVSNGESIINANSTSMFTPLLSSLNQLGGGVGFGTQNINSQVQGEEMLARAFAKGVSALPNPVVSVKEINTVNDRLTTIKELS